MKTIYLHIGRGKTGTTALQKFLSDSREVLRAAGVDYLLAGDRGRGVGHQEFAKSFITDMPSFMIPSRDPAGIRTTTAAEICASPADAILISSENFPLANLDILRDWFEALPVPTRIKVIFFVRSQDELAESEYNQMVKLKREARPFPDYAAALEGADYDVECAAWAARFGAENIIARIYDGAAQDVIARFLSCLPGLTIAPPGPDADPVPTAYANRSLGARALLTARMLNSIELEDRDALYRSIFAAFDGADLPAVLMSAAQAQDMRARFASGNALFCATYLTADPGQGTERYLAGDLGGRRYDDATRDRLYHALKALNIAL